jgi:hypothetical protein
MRISDADHERTGETGFFFVEVRVRRLVNPSQSRGLTEMGRQVATVIYVLAVAAIIVGVDFAFFRQRFWERLVVNIGIVLVFAAFYFRFLRHP